MERIDHPFPPVVDENSRILILGSFPSVKSRDAGFFYGHPQNRFWRLLSTIYHEPTPNHIAEKKALLFRHHIALWDVIAACNINGSSDASVKNAVPVDISQVINAAAINRVICNGKLAGKLYQQHLEPILGIKAMVLPSTSPANAGCSFESLVTSWRDALVKC